MKKRLTIGTPCHEDWNKMTPNDEGRHCDVCNKTVVDLTAKTQPEMVALFEAKGGDMCGRMLMPVETHRQVPVVSRPALRGRLRQFAIALLAAMGFITLGAGRAQAQSVPLPGAVAYVATADLGVHVSLNGAPTAGVQVQLKRANVVVKELMTNAEGFVSFGDLNLGHYTLVVRHQNQKLGSREVNLPNYGDHQFFLFEKTAERWKEVQVKELMGDTIGYQQVEVPILEEDYAMGQETVVEDPEPVTFQPIDRPVLMGKPALCNTQKRGEEAQAVEEVPPPVVGMDLKVFPNPTDGLFRAEIDGTHSGDGVHLTVFDASGKVLHQETHEGGNLLLLEVNLQDAAAGIYFVKVVHGDAVLEKRVVRL